MSSGESEDSTPAPWRRCRSDWQKSCAATRPRHRARRRLGFLVSRTTSARRPHRSRSNTCVRERCLEPTIFLGLDRQLRTTSRATSFKRSDVADRAARAQRFLLAVEPAVAGQHGDLRTFRICCRVVRGFELSDHEAMSVLSEWNARCQPPWSERELLIKVQNAQEVRSRASRCTRRRQRMSATHA